MDGVVDGWMVVRVDGLRDERIDRETDVKNIW